MRRPKRGLGKMQTTSQQDPIRTSARIRLNACVELLGDEECELLALQASRLVMGAKQYGPLKAARDSRDWLYEALCEALDGSNYLGIAIVRMQGVLARLSGGTRADERADVVATLRERASMWSGTSANVLASMASVVETGVHVGAAGKA